MRKSTRREQGFTLTELMITLAIAAITLGMVVPGFINFRSSLVRNQTRSMLVADLRYARQTAVTRHRSVVAAFGNGSATTNITTYSLHTDLDGDRVKDAGEPVLQRTLPNGSVLTSVSLTPTDSLIFDMSGALGPGVLGGSIVFKGPKGGLDTLNVSAVGMIYHP